MLILAWSLVGCSSRQLDLNIKKMTAQYLQSIRGENEEIDPKVASKGIVSSIRQQTFLGWGSNFWKTYSESQALSGGKKVRSELIKLINKNGASTLLVVPMSQYVRGPEDDKIIDKWLTSGVTTTKYFKELFGNPPDLQKVDRFRHPKITP